MRLKPAFEHYKEDYGKRCPLCHDPVYGRVKNKVYCSNACSLIKSHLSSIKKLIKEDKKEIILKEISALWS